MTMSTSAFSYASIFASDNNNNNNNNNTTTTTTNTNNNNQGTGRFDVAPQLAAVSSTSGQSNPSLSHDPGTGPTQSLAARLQELAVANADGLVDDHEYRLLRGQLFELYAGGKLNHSDVNQQLGQGREGVPRLYNRDAPPHLRAASSPPSAMEDQVNRHAPSLAAPQRSLRRPASFMSTASRARSTIGAFFRRSPKQSGSVLNVPFDMDSDPTLLKVPSAADASVGRSLYAQHPSLAALSPVIIGANGNGSGSSVRSLNQSADSHSGDVYSARSVFSGSVRARSSVYSKTRGAGSHFSPLSFTDEGVQPSSPPLASSTDPFHFVTAEREPTSDELRCEIEEIRREQRRIVSSWNTLGQTASSNEEGDNISAHRQAIADKYEARIAYLEARLDAALLRDKLAK